LCDGSNGTPDLRRRFLEGNDMSETFEFKEAALPNIRGRGNGYLLGADGVTTSPTTYDGSFITVSNDIHGIYGGVNTVRKVLITKGHPIKISICRAFIVGSITIDISTIRI